MESLFLGSRTLVVALWVNERRVEIDQRFDPHANPKMLGRYHFTLAHEAGHWRLHRRLFQRKANQPIAFTRERPASRIYLSFITRVLRVRPRCMLLGPAADEKLSYYGYTSTYQFASNKKYVCHGSTFLQNSEGDLLVRCFSFQLEWSMCRAIFA